MILYFHHLSGNILKCPSRESADRTECPDYILAWQNHCQMFLSKFGPKICFQNTDFPGANFGPVIGHCFFFCFSNFLTNFSMSDCVLYVGENFMKIT